METSILLYITATIASGSLGYILGLFHSSGRSKEAVQDPVRKEDMDSLRLFVEGAVDHIDHLYDRMRKRRMTEEAPKEPGDTSTLPRDGKEALRAIARARGFLPGGTSVERPNS